MAKKNKPKKQSAGFEKTSKAASADNLFDNGFTLDSKDDGEETDKPEAPPKKS